MGFNQRKDIISSSSFFGEGRVLHHAAYRILVPRPGIEPMPPAVERQSPKHWTAREFPRSLSLKKILMTYRETNQPE